MSTRTPKLGSPSRAVSLPGSQPRPEYVGKAAVAKMLGKSTRTVSRWITDGTFPKPVMLGSQTAWRLSDVVAWLDAQHAAERQGLIAAAVSDPSELPPEKLEDAIAALAGRLTGRNVTGFTIELSEEERAAALAANAAQLQNSLERLIAAYASLDVVRAWLVVCGLLPVLRPAAEKFLETITGVRVTQTQDEMRQLAIDIVDQAIEGKFVGPPAHPNHLPKP